MAVVVGEGGGDRVLAKKLKRKVRL